MASPGIGVIVGGAVVLWVANESWREKLPRNLIAGIRTPSTLRSDEAWTIANKVAAPLEAAGGAALVIGGTAAAILPARTGGRVLRASSIACAALCIAGALKGIRAAKAGSR